MPLTSGSGLRFLRRLRFLRVRLGPRRVTLPSPNGKCCCLLALMLLVVVMVVEAVLVLVLVMLMVLFSVYAPYMRTLRSRRSALRSAHVIRNGRLRCCMDAQVRALARGFNPDPHPAPLVFSTAVVPWWCVGLQVRRKE